VQGEHGVRVNPAYVEEVARVIEAALTRDVRGRFNVAGDQIVTLTDLVATIGELAGREPRLVWLSGTPPGDLVAANLRMKAELGVEPRTPLRAGLERTIAAIAPATGSGGEAAPPA
jgi:nucleoside-diphosphate-sugar epimerase